MSPRRLRAPALVALALIVGACSPMERPDPSASVPDLPPPPAAETMVVGVHIPVEQALGDAFDRTSSDLPLFSLPPNGSLWDDVVGRFVYSGVYRLDETQSPVPDLADAPCAVSADLLVVTCGLREATFHDGTPLTADDVAFTYQLLLSEACRLPACQTPDMDRLAAATALDERTVEFRLSGPDPTFITSVLASVKIEPQARVQRAFAAFVEAADGTDLASLEAVASRLETALHPGDPSDCQAPDEAVLRDAELALAEIGRELRSRDAYAIGAGGAFDTCPYGAYLVRVLTDAAEALSLTGVDAIAAAYRILDSPPTPVGSGPWRVISIEPGVSMELEAFGAFYRGIAATGHLEVRLIRSTAEAIDAVRSGAIHWLLEPFQIGGNTVAEGIGDAPGVVWVEYNELGFSGLFYNLREGRLFADPNLREAMELCIDKDETVAAATGGEGVSIYSPISPSIWAFEPDLPHPMRDTDAGRERIEASGWTVGEDGIYRKGGQRLATTVPVWEDVPSHVRFLELLAFQVAECGIEIVPRPLSADDYFDTLGWPLVPPGADQPWDAVFSGWFTTPDPDYSPIFNSIAITTPTNVEGNNYMGYASQEGDLLLEQARATYDPRERARLLRQHQRILAEDRPVLFAWSDRVREARSDRLGSTHGPLSTSTSTWWWELETLFIRSPEP